MLSIVCCTTAEHHSSYFLSKMDELAHKIGAEFVIGADGIEAFEQIVAWQISDGNVKLFKSRGKQEDIQDEVIASSRGDYVLLLDDDELVPPAMEIWLQTHEYEQHDHWKFPRMHLWPTVNTVIITPHLFPDHQVRLSVRKKAGGRRFIHDSSPYPGAMTAPVAIEHHKFLVKSFAERRQIAQRYERFATGFGMGPHFLAFSLPELAYDGSMVTVAEKGDGRVPWRPIWEDQVMMRCRYQ